MSSKCFLLSVFLLLSRFLLAHASLRRFSSCAALTSYYKREATSRVGPFGLDGQIGFATASGGQLRRRPSTAFAPAPDATNGAAPEAGVDFSETNVQVRGVDEPDIVKTDGRRVFVVSGNVFYVVTVGKNGASGKQVGKLQLPTRTFSTEMLIEGNNVLVIGSEYSTLIPTPRGNFNRPTRFGGFSLILPVFQSLTIVFRIGLKGNKPRLLETLRMEGRYISSREVGGIARIVTTANPSRQIQFGFRRTTDKLMTTRNKQIISKSTTGTWLSRYYLEDRSGKQTRGFVSPCTSVYRPIVFGGFDQLTITTLPLAGPLKPRNSVSIASDGDKVYSTASTLYVATTEYQRDFLGFETSPRSGPLFKTSFHKFALRRNRAKYVASGQVAGSVLNQFSMHEHKGIFFVATTLGAPWWFGRDVSVSKVSSFRTTKGKLAKIGEVGNLGVGERIFAVRYIGDTAYVVTFRQIDPLYIIDLSNPTRLKATGELKIPGFSSYLHPISPGRILGVGQEATPEGRTTGAKVTLFDVSNVSKPKELATWTLPGGTSSAQWDHRAFLYWEPEKVAVLPLSVFQFKQRFVGSIVLKIANDKITERGRVMHKECCGRFTSTPGILRNFILGRTHLWSLSAQQLQVNNIKNVEFESRIFLHS